MKKFLLVSILAIFSFAANALTVPPAAEASADNGAKNKSGKKKGKKCKKAGKKKGKKNGAKKAVFEEQFISADTQALVFVADPASPAKTPDKAKKTPRDLDAMFKKLDANGDSKVSKEEFAKITERKKSKKAAAAPADPEKKKKTINTDEVFTKLDVDKDGFLSLDEFKKFEGFRKKEKKTT